MLGRARSGTRAWGSLVITVARMATTRRRLPARVYWIRRVAVLGTALLLVFGLGRLLVGSSNGSDRPGPSAVQAAATLTSSPSSSGPKSRLPKGTRKPRPSPTPKPTPTPIAQPSGPCTPEDVVVTPEVQNPVGGGDIVIRLTLRTLVSDACTWDVSAKTLSIKITSGRDDIWSTRQCPAAIVASSVVVRRELATYVDVNWDARRSDSTCSRLTQWAYPGWYHVRVAALGGEPADEQFELSAPLPATVTTTVTPDPPKHTKKPKP
jgi:hypothetical protein